MSMKYFLLLIIIIFLTTCALFDGYKDNTHAMYARMLTSEEIQKLHERDTIEKTINTNSLNGRLLVLNLGYGKFNFVEIDKWEEHFTSSEYGEIVMTTEYDDYGNIRKRLVQKISKKTQGSSNIEEWRSDLINVDNDTVLIQFRKSIQKNQTYYTVFKVINFQTLQSDRLKEKIELDTIPSSLNLILEE